MVADQTLDRLAAHQVRDEGTHVAALGDVAGVAEAVHQLRPRACGTAGVPTELGRLTGEPITGQGRQHQVEGVLGGAAVSGRVGQRADGLEQLDDRAGPAMRHDQRQRVLMPGPDVDEVDLDPVDLGRELRQRVQSCLARAPVVLGRPVAGELPQRRQLHALRPILDELPGGPARGRDPAAKLDRSPSPGCSRETAGWRPGQRRACSGGLRSAWLMALSFLSFDPERPDRSRLIDQCPHACPPLLAAVTKDRDLDMRNDCVLLRDSAGSEIG